MAINRTQRIILLALNALGKHVYAGQETPAERAIRRRSDRLDKAIAIPGQARHKRRAVELATKSIARAERRRTLKEVAR